MVTRVPPDILQFKCYREFLGCYYAFKKSLNTGFSYRRFSQMVGLKSPNYIQLVIQGKRRMSEEVAARVAKTMGLLELERRYFIALVALDNAPNEEARENAQTELLRLVKRLMAKQIPKAQLQVMGQWYHLVIRELVLLPNFEASGAWIEARLRGMVTAEEAERSLKYLLRSGFLKIKNGRYIQADPVVDTGDALEESLVLNYHTSMLSTWAKMLPQLDSSKREYGVLNIPMASSKIPELRERIRRFQDEIIGWLQAETEPDRVVQLGCYLVPVSSEG